MELVVLIDDTGSAFEGKVLLVSRRAHGFKIERDGSGGEFLVYDIDEAEGDD